MCPLLLVLFGGVLFIMFLVGAATAAAAEPDAARDVAARQGETWACRGHGMFLERSKCWQHEKAALLMGYVL